MGTPEFAVPSLEAVAAQCDVVAVVTRPDRPRGRGKHTACSEVAAAAERLGREVLKPERVNAPEWRERLRALEPDWFAVVAYGAILSPELLEVPRRGSINLHGSILPDYRGASPVHRALWDGRAATGVTTMWVEEGLDTGDLILQAWEPIAPEDDAGTLGARLALKGAPLLAESLRLAHEGRAPRTPQDRAAGSYASRLAKSDGVMDWTQDAETVWNRQRAVTPWPGAATGWSGRRLAVTRSLPLHLLPTGRVPGEVVAATVAGVDVACGKGVLRVLRVKPEGKTEMSAADWANGARVAPGARLAREEEVRA